jgi:GTP-binding protein EngB required for normal cell division
MTSVLETAKRLVARGSDLADRLDGLATAVQACRGRLDDALVDPAQEVAERAASRLRLSAEHTVVALAGATGSGKSSTFNALTGLDLSAVGVRRPTTSWATACVWGQEGASELLEWLGIPARHQVMRDSMLDTGPADASLEGVVLLDLPDHDSTEVSHHLEVDRLVKLADLLVWVLDPQKYADAAIHDRYLAPLASHQEVMVVVLNHVDTVPEGQRGQMLADIRRLLDADGLTEVPLLATSARDGDGIQELKRLVADRVAGKKVTRARLEADVRAAAERLHAVTGDARPPKLSEERVAALEDAFADAAGVPTVVEAVEQSTRMRARRATGWPVTAWFSQLRPDPLKRLHLDLGASGRELTGRARTSVPPPTQVQRARVDTEVRALADDVATTLPAPWAHAVRAASVRHLDDLGDRLDGALADTDLGASRIPVWAGVVRALQWLLIGAALAGAAWLAVLFVLSYLQLSETDPPKVGGFPWPTVLFVGGVLAGVLLALVCRLLVGLTARSRSRTADRRLREGIAGVTEEVVVAPVRAELAAYGAARAGLETALR